MESMGGGHHEQSVSESSMTEQRRRSFAVEENPIPEHISDHIDDYM
jgi:hypothetical protein